MLSDPLLRKRKLHVIFSVTMIAVLGVASLTPALPGIALAFELSETQVGLLISAFTLPGIILTPIAGVLADRVGRKTVLVPSLFIFALAGFSIFFARNFYIILLLRVIQGLGAAPLGSINTTLVGDFFKGRERPAAMGYNASVLSLSTALYPLIGGVLAGGAWYYPFVLPLLAVPVGIFVISGINEPEIDKPASLKKYFRAVSASVTREVIAIFILGVLTFIILYGAFLTYIPFLLNQRFGLPSPQIGMVFALSSVISALMATQVGRLTQRFGSLNLLKTAFLLYLVVNLLVPNIKLLGIFLMPVILFGAAQALNIPSLQTSLANLAPDNQRGAFMSLNGMVLRIGQTLGPLVIGLGFIMHGIEGAYYLGALVSLLGLVVLFTMINAEKLGQSNR